MKNEKLDSKKVQPSEVSSNSEIIEEPIKLSGEEMVAAKEGIVALLRRSGSIVLDFELIKKTLNSIGEPSQSPEIQAAAKEGVVEQLGRGDVHKSLEIKKEFNLSDEIINLPEVQDAAKRGIINVLQEPYAISSAQAIEIKEAFNVSDEIVQAAAKEGITDVLTKGIYGRKSADIDVVLRIKEDFNLPDEMIQIAGGKGLIGYLRSGDIDSALDIIKCKNPPRCSHITILRVKWEHYDDS